MACKWRNGHHDTPHTKALTIRANTGPAERGRGSVAVVMSMFGVMFAAVVSSELSSMAPLAALVVRLE